MKPASLALATILLAACLPAQVLQAPFNGPYTLTSLGAVAGVPTSYAGLVFKATDPNTILMVGAAAISTAAIYEVPVTRGTGGHITGFGTPVLLTSAPNADGGLCYAPNLTLLFTTWPTNTMGQILFNTATIARTLTLTTYGIGTSTGSCQFVPGAYPMGGRFKIASYSVSTFYDVNLVPHAANDGTWDIASLGTSSVLSGGVEGIVYPVAGSPLIADFSSVLVSEYNTGTVALYTIDAVGNPVATSRQVFISGILGADGGAIDPVTNDVLFTTYGGGNQVVVVSGFGSCGTCTGYGTGHAGTGSLVPTLSCIGCARTGQQISINVQNALPNAFGSLNLGMQALNLQVLPGLFLLNNLTASVSHFSDGSGNYLFNLTVPNSPAYVGFHVFWQAGYLDAGAVNGISATAGIDQTIL
jgi:hypothetical protein